MTWYAETPALRTRQVLTDLAVLAWAALWVGVAVALHDAVTQLAGPGRRLEQAGGDLAGGLTDAAQRAGDLPLVGGSLRTPLDAAAGAGLALAGAGVAQQEAVERLALLLAVVVVVLPVGWALARWLPGRLRWRGEAAAATALHGDVELLALRAATSLPLRELATLGPEPVARWRRGEPGAAEALAALQLRSLGVRPLPPRA